MKKYKLQALLNKYKGSQHEPLIALFYNNAERLTTGYIRDRKIYGFPLLSTILQDEPVESFDITEESEQRVFIRSLSQCTNSIEIDFVLFIDNSSLSI